MNKLRKCVLITIFMGMLVGSATASWREDVAITILRNETLKAITKDGTITVDDDMTLNSNVTFTLAPSLPAGSVDASDINVASNKIIIGNNGATGEAFQVTGDIALSNGGVASISSGAVVDADVSATAAIAASKMEAVAPGSILVGNSSTSLTEVAVSGVVALSDAGVTTFAASVISTNYTSVTNFDITIVDGSITVFTVN